MGAAYPRSKFLRPLLHLRQQVGQRLLVLQFSRHCSIHICYQSSKTPPPAPSSHLQGVCYLFFYQQANRKLRRAADQTSSNQARCNSRAQNRPIIQCVLDACFRRRDELYDASRDCILGVSRACAALSSYVQDSGQGSALESSLSSTI